MLLYQDSFTDKQIVNGTVLQIFIKYFNPNEGTYMTV